MNEKKLPIVSTLACAAVCFMLPAITVNAAGVEKMTYKQAVQRIPKRLLPDFWIGDVNDLPGRWEKLKLGQVKTIATSPGGRPIHLISYGRFEKVKHIANFNSAIGAWEPSAYMDKAARKNPVVYFVGPVHGHEVEALTGLVNFIQIMETGQDLRGTDQSALRRLAQQCRLLIVPAGNPDGIARFRPRSLAGMEFADMRFWGQGTYSDDTLCGWPQCKRQHPMKGKNTGFLGCYFNDDGINLMHDEFFGPMSPEAPAILRVARDEGPDLAVSLHSCEYAPALFRPAYVTVEVQKNALSLAKKYYTLLEKQSMPHGKPFRITPEGGERPQPFNLTSALYHISGATTFTFECPHGISGRDYCNVSPEQILDIQLLLYEAMLEFAIENKASGSLSE
jgi:hypothetical protein